MNIIISISHFFIIYYFLIFSLTPLKYRSIVLFTYVYTTTYAWSDTICRRNYRYRVMNEGASEQIEGRSTENHRSRSSHVYLIYLSYLGTFNAFYGRACYRVLMVHDGRDPYVIRMKRSASEEWNKWKNNYDYFSFIVILLIF